MLSHERVWAAIDALAARYSLSASGLAKRAGLDSTAFNKSKRTSADGRPRWPSTESLSKIIEATHATLDEFLELVEGRAPEAKNRPNRGAVVPMVGFAQAGVGGYFEDAGFQPGDGFELVDLPENAAEGTFALGVQGDSMLPLYRKGDILIVRPDTALRQGDRVVVRTRGGEVMAKILQRQTATSVELGSLNPEHAERQVPLADVEWMARILWASQ
jgi:phage repressor protein C with HTH and peptisase S24 domain